MLSPLPTSMRESLLPGKHRPIYLWAGPGTVRMNRLKFMRAKVNEEVHHQAHTSDGVRRVLEETGCHWIYLMYNWGFPPEVEKEDWDSFESAAWEYHHAGGLVFAYIQTSNCVFDGSFRKKDWYACDRHGRPIYYYTGRYMTCWENSDWLDYLKERVADAISRGADGIFFDNPWHAAQPMHLGGAWLGGAGCYCARCRAAYRLAESRDIPRVIQPGEPETDHYLRWRSEKVTLRIREMAEYVRTIKADAPVSVNNFDAVMRPSLVAYGIDLAQLARVQDMMMIEDYGLPRWTPGIKNVLVNNALTLRTARTLCGETPVSVDPYDRGIGFDHVFSARRYLQAIGEAAACRASCVVKGTEFVDEEGVFTLLTDERYTDIRLEIGNFQQWLEEQAGLLHGGQNLAKVGLLYPRDRFWHNDGEMARLYFGCGQTLIAAGIPWKAVQPGDELAHLRQLLVFDLRDLREMKVPGDLNVLDVCRLNGWHNRSSSGWLEHNTLIRRLLSRGVGEVIRGYFAHRLVRKVMDRVGVMKFFTGSPFFHIPEIKARETLLEAFPKDLSPSVSAEAPVLMEVWEQDGTRQIHLLNYSAHPQTVSVQLEHSVNAKILSHGLIAPLRISGQELKFDLDVYSIVLIES